jgi:16S rRNA (guanine527-N7)-methyltransferase
MTAPRAVPRPGPPAISEAAKARLDVFVALLQKWNKAINLVSAPSLANAWDRHVLDSAQLAAFLRDDIRIWADFGSGGGLPGVVVAAIAADDFPMLKFVLVESDQRKAAFLQTVSRETGLSFEVVCQRLEAVPPLEADIVSARALAPLDKLCAAADRHLGPDGKAIFLKGSRADEEVSVARINWSFDLKVHRSGVEPAGSILEVSNLQHV